MKHLKSIMYADDDTESTPTLLRLRIPSLFLGLVLGFVVSFAVSRFEQVLSQDVRVVFFLPFIVYMAAAIGAQTQNIYSRDLKTGKARFHNYLIKESSLGCMFGVIFGVVTGLLVEWWLVDSLVAASIGLSMFGAALSAPIVALLTTEGLERLGEDPAVYAGPIATVIQDTISVIIYGVVCSQILL